MSDFAQTFGSAAPPKHEPVKPWFRPTAWTPWRFKERAIYVPPPGSGNPFAGYNEPAALPARFQPVQAESIAPAIIPAYMPPVGTSAAVDADGLDMGRPLDLPPPAPPPAIPGLMGELVDYCWQAAPWQVAEVAIGSALSLMSLLCSRVYRHGTLGLSLYLLVLAKTSTGKSFGYSANDRIFGELIKHFESTLPPHSEEGKRRAEAAKKMIIGEIGSAQGLAQHIPNSPSTLFHGDEYVEHIKMMAAINPPQNVAATRAELLRLMEMSGPGRVYRGRKYSKRSSMPEEVDVLMASLSILATGVPEAFYDDIGPNLLTSGFLPRFTVLEYQGNLTRPNPSPQPNPSARLMEQVQGLFNQAYTRGKMFTGALNEVIDVTFADQAAEAKMRWYENVCVRRTADANDRDLPTSGLWSRAKEHAKQIASLIAIGVNPYNPRIEVEHVDVAVSIITPSLEKICAKFEAGEIGITDDRRQADIRMFIAKCLLMEPHKFARYPNARSDLIAAGVVQLTVVRNQCRKFVAFKNHPLGSNRAFDDAIANMVKYGELHPVVIHDYKGPCVTVDKLAFAQILRIEANKKGGK